MCFERQKRFALSKIKIFILIFARAPLVKLLIKPLIKILTRSIFQYPRSIFHPITKKEFDPRPLSYSKAAITVDQTPIFLDASYTSTQEINTGIQRVVRNIAISLLELGYNVHFVKSAENSDFQYLSLKELRTLFLYCNILPFEVEEIYQKHKNLIVGDLPSKGWLFVPELNYNYALIGTAKKLGLKTAYIFYDAIPLVVESDCSRSQTDAHIGYMKKILSADVIISISTFSKKQLLDFAENNKITIPLTLKLYVLHLACSFIEKSFPNPVRNKRPYILSVGSISTHKNQLTLIHAFKKFKEENPRNNFMLVLAGNVWLNAKHLVYQEAYKSSDIIIHESASDETIQALYQHCSFTVFPSIIEGFGLPIIESLFFKKPCITSDWGAMAEVAAKPGCIVINTRSKDELKKYIAKMILDMPFRETKMREVATVKIENWHEYTKKMIDCIFEQDIAN